MDYQQYHTELFFALLSFDLSFDDVFFFGFWFLIIINTLHLLHLIFVLMMASFLFSFLITVNTLHLLKVLHVVHFTIAPITKT